MLLEDDETDSIEADDIDVGASELVVFVEVDVFELFDVFESVFGEPPPQPYMMNVFRRVIEINFLFIMIFLRHIGIVNAEFSGSF